MDFKKTSFNRFLLQKKAYNSAGIQALLKNPDRFLDSSAVKYLKNNPNDTSTVGVVTVDNIPVVIKRYNVKSLSHRIKLWLRKSRAMISWNNTHLLMAAGIPTIDPIAVIEERFGFLRSRAYFIYHYAAGTSCSAYFEKQTELTPHFKMALNNIAASLKKMKANHIYHRDLHHNNMVLLDDKVLIVDLDHVKKYHFFRWRFEKSHQKDLEKFLHYLGDNVAAKEYFLRKLSLPN